MSHNHTHLGHGGDGYLQFQDQEEISSAELADAFQQMWQKKRYLIMLLMLGVYSSYRYNELLFIIDTCQAASMSKLFYSPNIIGVGSSLVGEESLSVLFLSIYSTLYCNVASFR